MFSVGGNFSTSKLFVLKSSHRNSETVTQELLLEYTEEDKPLDVFGDSFFFQTYK